MSLLIKLKKYFTTINTRTIYFYSFLTGIISGLVAVLFHESIHYFLHLTESASLSPNKTLYFLLPILGGLVTGGIIHFFGKEAGGGGTETFLDSFHNKTGNLKKRITLTKFFASVSTLGTGGSGGKEGPMMLIGSSLGALLGRFIKMGARARRTLLLAGAAGGLGAIFRTPLGGAITAVEVLYKEDFESDALIPCIISSVTAYTTFGFFLGFSHVIQYSADMFQSPIELIFYAILALICTGMGFVFVKAYNFLGNHVFNKLPLPAFLLPAVGGLLIGITSLFLPGSIGSGIPVIQNAIDGVYSTNWITACQLFLILAIAKILTTGFTIQSGGSAGTLIPSFFIGAMIGGLVGTVFHHFFPVYVPSVTPFIIIGMAAFFSAVTNASLGALVMVTELTGGYELLPALMVVAVISLIVSHKWSIYKNQAANKFFSKAHLWDMNPVILKSIQISASFSKYHQEAIIDRQLPLSKIRALAHKLHQTEFLVMDEHKQLLGHVTLHDLDFNEVENNPDLNALCVAEDMLHGQANFVRPKDSLFKVISLLTNTESEIIPVVHETTKELLGYLTRKDVLKYYNELGTKDSSNPKGVNI